MYNSDCFTILNDSLVSCSKQAFGAVIVPSDISEICEQAFNNCLNLKGIVCHDTLERIGKYAFSGSSLWHFTFPLKITAIEEGLFLNCKDLRNVTLNEHILNIGNFAFSGCLALNNLIMPDSVRSIGNNAFQNCFSLKKISLPNTLSFIGEYAFSGCQELETIIIPEGITHIHKHTFSGCKKLRHVILPKSVISIDDYDFENCHSLTDIELPNSINYVGINIFEGCHFKITNPLAIKCSNLLKYCTTEFLKRYDSQITDKTLYPKSLNIYELEDKILYSEDNTTIVRGGYRIDYLHIKEGIKRIGTYAFGSSSLKEIYLSDTLEVIEEYAFFESSQLVDIEFNNNLVKIGPNAFAGTNLLYIELPNSLAYIGDEAFKSNTHLRYISFPQSLTFVGNSILLGAINLKEIEIHSTNPDIFPKDFAMLVREKDCIIRVPTGSLELYRQHESFKDFNIMPLVN